jgi:hypothetical protein
MSGWSRAPREPGEEPPRDDEERDWNPGRLEPSAPEDLRPTRWKLARGGRSPLQKALARRSPLPTEAEVPATEPAPAGPPPATRPARVERGVRAAPTSAAWRAQAGKPEPSPGAAPPQRRLEHAESALPPSPRAGPTPLGARARLWSGTAGRLLVALAIFAVCVTAPLLMIHRSTCTVRGVDRDRWTFVPPGGDQPKGCHHHVNGLQVLLGQD